MNRGRQADCGRDYIRVYPANSPIMAHARLPPRIPATANVACTVADYHELSPYRLEGFEAELGGRCTSGRSGEVDGKAFAEAQSTVFTRLTLKFAVEPP